MFLSTARRGLFIVLSTFCLLHKISSMNSLFMTVFFLIPSFPTFRKQEWICQMALVKGKTDMMFLLLSISQCPIFIVYWGDTPVTSHQQTTQTDLLPRKRLHCWNPVSFTTLDQRQSVSIVYDGSKIKTSKNCKNNKQKAPNKQSEPPPWAHKCSDTQLLRRSSLWIQCSGVTGNLNCCVNIHALWQLCYPGIWQLSEPGKSLTLCCHKSASKQSHHMFMQRDKLLSLGSGAWGWNIEHSSNKCNIKPGSLPSSSIKFTSF